MLIPSPVKESQVFGAWTEELPVIVFECNRSGELLAISPYWEELTGRSIAEALGTGWMQFFDGDALSTIFAEVTKALARGELGHYVVRCRRRNGEWCWLRTLLRARLQDGEITSLVGFATVAFSAETVDEMSRVRIEEAERVAARADALLAASPDFSFQVTDNGTYIGFRSADPSGLHVSPEKFLGKTFESVLPNAIALQFREALGRARETKLLSLFVYVQPVDGTERSFEARALPMRGGDFLFVIRDVTEARRNEAELVAAREEALERSALKTQFLANVSHEIRTPLNGILGVTQLLKQHSLPEEFREYVDVLQGAGESLLAIVNDVLDLSKIEANRLELEPRVFDLEKIVTETARSFLGVAQRKGIELVLNLSPEARGPVRGDPTRMRQIINNLVGNAVKFTDTGSVRVSVVRKDAERVHIKVQDTGPGIASEHHSRIFEAFEQADVGVQRRFGGTGLGLAITRRVVRLMGGDVVLTSAVGEGSTFELEVPLPSVVISYSAPTVSRPVPVQKSLRVLLAEDDPVNASMTAALLRKLGHVVHVVNNGRECVNEAARGETDLVLMDVHMPVLDGLNATRRIREGERGSERHLPIVALTANAMKGDDVMCLSAGMDAYLPKPVTVSVLKDLLSWFGSQQP